MSPDELDARLAAYPKMCQQWVSAQLLHDGGVLYLSSIQDTDERIGTVHVLLWDKHMKGRPALVRLAAKKLMESEKLARLVCEISLDNKLAIRLAERVGMKRIGVVRARKSAAGGLQDVLLMDALPGDLHG